MNNSLQKLKHQLINDAKKQKHSLNYFINNSYKKNNLIIFNNEAIPDKISFFRELLYYYHGSSILEFKNIHNYTLCFWRNGKKCFCGIYDLALQKILNRIDIIDNKISKSIHTS